MRKGLYANIHAKRKRGEKMRKKGAKGAPTAANFARAKQTARKPLQNYVQEVKQQLNVNSKYILVHTLMLMRQKYAQAK